MCTLLTIETSTHVCSCALSRNGNILISKVNYDGQSHASLLGLYVHEIMEYLREQDLVLNAVAVSSGPGSYTGLRIGVSQAKGVCYGLNIPLIAIPTHRLMASMMQNKVSEDTLLCPMIDARRMEVYAAIYDVSMHVVRETSADIVDEETYAPFLQKREVAFFGNGAAKCQSVITHPNALFIEDIHPLASGMIPLAEQAFREGVFVDAAYFEPFYLKEFVATVPKNKVLPNQK